VAYYIPVWSGFSPGNYGLIEPCMISVSVCVCVSVNMDLWAHNSGPAYPFNLKFCSLIGKAVVQVKILTAQFKLFLKISISRWYGSKRRFFRFFTNNSGTKLTHSIFLICCRYWIFTYLMFECQVSKMVSWWSKSSLKVESSSLFECDILYNSIAKAFADKCRFYCNYKVPESYFGLRDLLGVGLFN